MSSVRSFVACLALNFLLGFSKDACSRSDGQCSRDSISIALEAAAAGVDRSEGLMHLQTRATNHKSSDKDPDASNLSSKSDRETFFADHACEKEPTLERMFKIVDEQGGFKHHAQLKNNYSVYLRLKIQNGTLLDIGNSSGTAEFNSKALKIVPAIKALLEEVELPDMTIALNYLDNADDEGNLGILLSEGQADEDFLSIPRSLIDDQGTLGREVYESAKWGNLNCTELHSGAVFRGSASGVDWLKQPDELPLRDSKGDVATRYQVAELSLRRPDLLDAGFVEPDHHEGLTGGGIADLFGLIPHKQDLHTKLLKGRKLLRPFMNDTDQRCYDAIVVVDGNSLPDRLPYQLGYGIPVVFVRNKIGFMGKQVNEEFWYSELTPWVDFIPATVDDLESVLEKLMVMPRRQRELIGWNGRHFVITRLSEDRLMCYLYQLLEGYGSRM
eukprot:TRINITY_DN12217_c0_g5_i1.p1 TRINITY_DN12217_c0_g5~~TRINITY_DN12217_c0_g5_i1.p1  ORF type:complete len:443 (-),score=69.54 TRINITY_DN12217_c0_g5_i1:243-1571(-)